MCHNSFELLPTGPEHMLETMCSEEWGKLSLGFSQDDPGGKVKGNPPTKKKEKNSMFYPACSLEALRDSSRIAWEEGDDLFLLSSKFRDSLPPVEEDLLHTIDFSGQPPNQVGRWE
ncbi:hypothetical protein AVEN_238814-1 [Araneus ventricosus]|uniref:Uncharacterized protein n=1 Tax=Araneus ventricosus TaxID=182803 RepID=A0A4Y2HKI8_ARAVE|nr:hypothetical protein AVEN_238814-1 [Araneus ventricosus]